MQCLISPTNILAYMFAGNWFDVAHANLYFRTQVANVCGPFEGLFPIYPKIALTTICMGLDLIIQSIKMLLKVGHTICDDWKMFKVKVNVFFLAGDLSPRLRLLSDYSLRL